MGCMVWGIISFALQFTCCICKTCNVLLGSSELKIKERCSDFLFFEVREANRTTSNAVGKRLVLANTVKRILTDDYTAHPANIFILFLSFMEKNMF